MKTLPRIMVAPNGARRTKNDHCELPITIAEIVDCAEACHSAGAGAIHAHVRNDAGEHVLDAGLYRELIAEMAAKVPGMHVQITTEAIGNYTAEYQRRLVRTVMPKAVSVSLAEMFSDGDRSAAIGFYQWAAAAGIAVQHILYDIEDFRRFTDLAKISEIPASQNQVLFVLGRYAPDQKSSPADLEPFVGFMETEAAELDLDWAVCAFGYRQTECLIEAIRRGGKARIGFENGLWLRNGNLARNNADLVTDLAASIALAATRNAPLTN